MVYIHIKLLHLRAGGAGDKNDRRQMPILEEVESLPHSPCIFPWMCPVLSPAATWGRGPLDMQAAELVGARPDLSGGPAPSSAVCTQWWRGTACAPPASQAVWSWEDYSASLYPQCLHIKIFQTPLLTACLPPLSRASASYPGVR